MSLLSYPKRLLAIGRSRHEPASKSKKTGAHNVSGAQDDRLKIGHGAILDRFEETARLGFVPAEALIARLYASHCDELAEEKRQLDALEQSLEAHLRRLDALYPAAVPPPPTPPQPPRARTFRRLGDTWAQPDTHARH